MLKRTVVFCVITAILLSSLPLLFLTACRDKEKITVYEIDCVYSDGCVTGTENVTFYNSTENPVAVLKFNLYANAFRKGAEYSPIPLSAVSQAYYDGMSYGEIDIKSVSPCKEFYLGGKDKNVLYVTLNEQVFPEDRVTIKIDYTLTLAKVIARTGINDKTVNLANFYPILCADDYECVYYSVGDPFYSDVANYKVKFTADKDFVVASSGVLKKQSTENDATTYIFSLENARSFCIVLSKDYKTVTDKSTGVEIVYCYYSDDNPVANLGFAVESMKLFTECFGAYPYAKYTVCQTRFLEGGMEYPCLAMISDSLDGLSYGEVIVHETAHQWWQTAVGNNEIEYPFLDEGLAEYSVVLFYERYAELGLTREKLISMSEEGFKQFCSVYKKLFGKADTSMLRGIDKFGSDYEYVNVTYIEPCIMYDTLRRTIGDSAFFKGLRTYFTEYKFKNAVPDDLVGIFERVGADTNGFFDSFFKGKIVI